MTCCSAIEWGLGHLDVCCLFVITWVDFLVMCDQVIQGMWCLADWPGVFLHTQLCHMRQLENLSVTDGWRKDSTATVTYNTLSSSQRPQDIMGKANSQCLLWGEDVARNDVRWFVEFRLASTSALSFITPGWSQNHCLVDKIFGTLPNCVDQSDLEGQCAHSRSDKGSNCQQWHTSHRHI